jgi:A/G-specific adenine glycosylase
MTSLKPFQNTCTGFSYEDKVMALWAGLGYYSRARNLHKTAKIVSSRYRGVFPKNESELISLPGIGPSTAGAILSLGSNLRAPILDGNVKRVLTRYHMLDGHYSEAPVMKKLWSLASFHTPSEKNAEYTQAIMDIGATVCTPKNPHCDKCPISRAVKHSSTMHNCFSQRKKQKKAQSLKKT